MDSIRQGKIRKIYYVSNLAIILFMVFTLNVPVLINLNREYERKEKQLSTSIINQKKLYLETIILEKIADIDLIREETASEINKYAVFISDSIAALLRNKYRNGNDLINSVDSGGTLPLLPVENLQYSIIDKVNNKVIYSSLGISHSEQVLLQDMAPVLVTVGILDNIDVNVFIQEDVFLQIIIEKAKTNIRNTRLSNNGYIWVNNILIISGGDDYAIRCVHPNLPETEGDFLSTEIRDVEGNTPYQAELDGINSEGEVFYEYFFKKMNSDTISRKLSYARLYKDFDWIIATGVHLDDVSQLIDEEQSGMREIFTRDIRFISVIIVIVLIISIAALINFEKRINRLILRQTSALYNKNRELTSEKKKVEEAYSKIRKIAYHDPLTGLWNRRAMFNRFREEMARSLRSDQKFCMIICDIDYFKRVNDTLGHSCGDYVLEVISGILKDSIRGEDSVARWGGEEFLILMNNSDLLSGAVVAEKLRETVEKQFFEYEGSPFEITMTFGVSEFIKNEKIDEVIKSADDKLYYGKEHGKNCVISESTERREA